MKARYAVLLFSLVTVSVCAQTKLADSEFGNFTGTLKLQPTGDGKTMIVLEQFSYSDRYERLLVAKPGFRTDGASIPRPLWSVVGSPFTGPYLPAAVIHDVGCETHKYPWQTTHRMFYDAMRAKGVSEYYAKVLYWGVRIGGPRWDQQVVSGERSYVEAEVLRRTGKSIAELPPERVTENHHAFGPPTFDAVIEIPVIGTQTLTDAEAARIQETIKARESSATGPITLDEIDAQTPLIRPDTSPAKKTP